MKNLFMISFFALLGLLMLSCSEGGKNAKMQSNKAPVASKAMNPCATKNVCAPETKMMNACSPMAKNACSPAEKNACSPGGETLAMNPCGMSEGVKLWYDKSLSINDTSCMSCHEGGEMLNQEKNPGPFPHFVKMPNKVITLKGMINFCLETPMESKALSMDDPRLQAMADAYPEIVAQYQPEATNACSPAAMNACNPCAAKNACSPATKNPCAPQ